MSSLPAVLAFDVISRVLSPTDLLAVLELTGVAILKLTGVAVLELTRVAVLELTRGLLGILFLSTVIDMVSLLLAILANRSLSTIGVEKGSGRVVSRIADLIVG